MRSTLVLCLTIIVTSAQARTCIRTLPEEASVHWHYRYVDGKKCWHGPGGHIATSHDRRVTSSYRWSISRKLSAKVPVREGQPNKAPVPVEAITQAPLEPQPPSSQPSEPEPTRVKTLTIKPPPTASQRLEDAFDAFVKRCEHDLNACTGLDH
jgi:hypothetical protein